MSAADARLGPRPMHKSEFDAAAFFAAVERAVHARGYTMAGVARETGVTSSTLTRMMQGRRIADGPGIAALSAWAGINPANYRKAAP